MYKSDTIVKGTIGNHASLSGLRDERICFRINNSRKMLLFVKFMRIRRRKRCIMLDVLLEEDLITICIVIFFGISIIMQGLLSIFYQNMIDEAENMATTEHKMLKQCKLKFSNCYQLNGGVANIPVFVDKFLGKLSFGRISFETMYHISGQTMLLSVVSAGVGICKSIVKSRSIVEILPFYIVCFLELYLYFSITSMLDVKGRKQKLKVNLVDYLENHLSSRIEITAGDIRMLYGEDFRELKGKKEQGKRKQRTLAYTPITSVRKDWGEIDGSDEEWKETGDKEEENERVDPLELENLLKEFLTS